MRTQILCTYVAAVGATSDRKNVGENTAVGVLCSSFSLLLGRIVSDSTDAQVTRLFGAGRSFGRVPVLVLLFRLLTLLGLQSRFGDKLLII